MISNEIFLLNKVGLTDGEAKVYLALLQHGSLSGYEASKLALVPRSKVYNILESLVSKGFILYSKQENNNIYAALPIDEVVKKVRYEMGGVLESLEEQLKEYPTQTDLDYIWHIRKNSNVFAKCREIIQRTKGELLLQIWEEDLPHILGDIQKLEEQNIPMGIVYFSNKEDQPVPLKKYFRHGLVDEKKKEMGGRWITLVSDRKEVVFGQIIGKNVAEVIWTKSKPMIIMAAECVKHDIYFYKNASIFQQTMERELGKDYKKIRDIY